MNELRGKSRAAAAAVGALAAALGLALAAPGGGAAGTAAGAAAKPRAFVPDEVLVGLRGGESRLVRLPARTPIPEAIAALERSPRIAYAQRNWIATSALVPLDTGTSEVPTGWQQDQWSFLGKPGGVRAPRAWDNLIVAGSPGGAGATVAVVDTGIAYADARGGGYALSPDFDAEQFVPGTDLVAGDDQPFDENGHGTHVAGTIAEQVTVEQPALEEDYLTGLAYGARLMPVRVLDSKGEGTAEKVSAGILWAARNGADVINLSLQFASEVRSCDQVPAVCHATRKASRLGALVVAAAGNALEGLGKPRALFPAAAPDVLAVGATTEHGCLAVYSHYRRRTDLLAPGGGTPRASASRPSCEYDSKAVLQTTFECFSSPGCSRFDRFAMRPDLGTSMAAAHASGVAAMVEASGVAGQDPDAEALAERLTCTARGGLPERYYGAGLLDAARATDPRRRCG